MLADSCEMKRLKELARALYSRGFIASDIFHGTRIARRGSFDRHKDREWDVTKSSLWDADHPIE